MNYRHSFHAGNSADVVKHSLLIALVQALQQKQTPLTLIDTHAGCGLYDLFGEDAQRTGESLHGVMRAFADQTPVLDDYRAAVRVVNVAAEPNLYPGSPRFLAQLLRPQDFLILNEKHPEDVRTLRRAMRDTPAAVHERDAYEFWLAMVPPRTARGVVVIDPPYEQPDERDRIVTTLADYAEANRLDHAGLDALIAHLRAYPDAGDPMALPSWDRAGSQLQIAGRGDPLPASLLVQIATEKHDELNDLICLCVEVGTADLYGGPTDIPDQMLAKVQTIQPHGMSQPTD